MYDFASGMQFGLIGYAAAGGESAGDEVKNFADHHQIDISNIVYQQWVKQIDQNPYF